MIPEHSIQLHNLNRAQPSDSSISSRIILPSLPLLSQDVLSITTLIIYSFERRKFCQSLLHSHRENLSSTTSPRGTQTLFRRKWAPQNPPSPLSLAASRKKVKTQSPRKPPATRHSIRRCTRCRNIRYIGRCVGK